MQAVGRLGSYISRSVYTVSGPFHPFGGAVDIIVVEQPDGSYKSSPWNVRFGKFQGVLKSKEKVVNISVNGVDADFHMYLDHKGEAFFLREVDVEERESVSSPPYSSGEDVEGKSGNRWPLKSKSCNFDYNWSDSVRNERKAVTRADSRRSQFLGLVFGRRTASEEGVQMKEDPSGVVRSESLELAEFAADLLDLKWSTNLASSKTKSKKNNTKSKKNNASVLSDADTSKDGVSEKFSVDGCSHDEKGHIFQERTTEENDVEMKHYIVETTTTVGSIRKDITLSNSEQRMSDYGESDFHVSSVNIISEVAESDSQIQETVEKLNGLSEIQQCLGKEEKFNSVHEAKILVSGGATQSIVTECYSQLVHLHQSNGSLANCSPIEDQNVMGEKDKHETSEGYFLNSVPPRAQAPRNADEELLLFGDIDDFGSSDAKNSKQTSDHEQKEADYLFSLRVADGSNESNDAKCCSSFLLEQPVIGDCLDDADVQNTRLCSVSSEACISENGHDRTKGLTRMARSLPIFLPLTDNLKASDLGQSSYPKMYPDKNHRSPGAQTKAEDVAVLKDNKDEPASTSERGLESMDSLGRSRSNWPFPFNRSRGRNAESNGRENPKSEEALNNSNDLERGTDLVNVKIIKKEVRALTPTSEQLASLNLKEGKNIVIFTFSTAMLGKQQVDARIFLWRWDTRIVISDVDGTITRSDLLGQVMPLVGMDWSQTGVAHLFSAIKENGYQLLFLSARSISQSFITRQFLFNINQDGKALPDGPVVISPDGLFPSLFREVVRRAPHEFKISCLEEIKALFPPDRNPFYAGFGNRDTDEFSYLKVGIPRGKIFIINPKGEIAVNRRVDTKSYLALHALVHGMFPTMSTCEQEDYNTWNYWKLPPPIIDL